MLIPQPIQQVPNDLDRCWMRDDYFDLIVWYTPEGAIEGFQLCYEKSGDERALTWRHTGAFVHSRVEGGESSPLANRTPILVSGGEFPFEQVRDEFLARSEEIGGSLRELVLAKLTAYASRAASP